MKLCSPRFASLWLTALMGAAMVGWQPATSRAAELDVYILTGQSNSLGTTSLETEFGPGADEADAETALFWSNVNASNTQYPPVLYGDSGGGWLSLKTQQGDGGVNPQFWGPEFGLARRLYDRGDRDVMIIKASRGGGGNTLWDQDAFDSNVNAGHMWGHLSDTVDAALAALHDNDTFSIKGFVYLQGESNSSAEAALADSRLENLIDNLEAFIDVTYPGAAADMHTVVAEIAASGASARRIQTTQLQSALAAGDDDISFVTTSDLPLKSDEIHFGRDAKLTIGERVADAFFAISEQPNDVVGDVNQDGVLSTGSGDPLTDDVAALIAGWRSDTTGLTNLQKTLRGDLDLSGRTTIADVYLLHTALEDQGMSSPFQSLYGVPEPTAVVLMLPAAGLLLGGRRAARRAYKSLP